MSSVDGWYPRRFGLVTESREWTPVEDEDAIGERGTVASLEEKAGRRERAP